MTNIIKQVNDALSKRGFIRHEADSWCCDAITVRYRPSDSSFLGHWTDGRLQDYTFFDFEDEEQVSYQFVTLLDWVKHYQNLPAQNHQRQAA